MQLKSTTTWIMALQPLIHESWGASPIFHESISSMIDVNGWHFNLISQWLIPKIDLTTVLGPNLFQWLASMIDDWSLSNSFLNDWYQKLTLTFDIEPNQWLGSMADWYFSMIDDHAHIIHSKIGLNHWHGSATMEWKIHPPSTIDPPRMRHHGVVPTNILSC